MNDKDKKVENIDRLNRIESRISKLEVSSKNLLNKVSQLSLIKKA